VTPAAVAVTGSGQFVALYFDVFVAGFLLQDIGEEVALFSKEGSVPLPPPVQREGDARQYKEGAAAGFDGDLVPVRIAGFVDVDDACSNCFSLPG